jgi:hypothetical protein
MSRILRRNLLTYSRHNQKSIQRQQETANTMEGSINKGILCLGILCATSKVGQPTLKPSILSDPHAMHCGMHIVKNCHLDTTGA